MVKWKGLKKAQGNFSRMKKGLDKQMDTGLDQFGDYAVQKISENAVFVKGYSRGHLRRALTSERNKTGVAIKSPAYYSGWVEWGTRYMDAQPYFFPTLKVEVKELGKFIMKR